MSSNKGILKIGSIDQIGGKDKPSIHVRFDEEELSQYDLQRGKKMKILEPNTPFEFSDQE